MSFVLVLFRTRLIVKIVLQVSADCQPGPAIRCGAASGKVCSSAYCLIIPVNDGADTRLTFQLAEELHPTVQGPLTIYHTAMGTRGKHEGGNRNLLL